MDIETAPKLSATSHSTESEWAANMASAQLMEEELQHSVMISEPDVEVEMQNIAEVNSQDDIVDEERDDLEEDDDIDAEGEDDVDMDDEDDERVGDAGEDDTASDQDDDESDGDDGDGDGDGDEEDDGVFEDDAEGEDDDIVETTTAQIGISGGAGDENEDEDDEDEEEDEEDEGVGAVKIKPGETDESEEDDASEAGSASEGDSDGAAAWEDNAENDEEDEESDNANRNVCMFCRQDEDNDPSEEFEAYLTCSGCGENAHQQCARDNKARGDESNLESWSCLDCAAGDVDHAASGVGEEDEDEAEAEANGMDDANSPTGTRRATAPKLARDLLPSQRGAIKPDSHSVFNQLVLDEDPMDGSRVLRKRKTSSAEADENIISLRKRRRNTADDLSIDGAQAADDSTRPHSARSLRLKVASAPPVTVVKRTRTNITVKMKVNPTKLQTILSKKPKGNKKSSNKSEKSRSSRPGTARSAVHVGSSMATPLIATNFSSSQPFYSFFDKETDELKGKPYGGILDEAEADTSKTLPANDDRRRFDEAKQKAEEEWRQRVLAMQSEIDVTSRKPKKSSGPASQIECIEFGGFEIDTWYAAPYPEEYSRNRVLYICEFCLKYMNSAYVAWRHKLKCPAKHPPGDEIYRCGSISIFEVDGRKNPVYCQNLCLLAKLFLGSKTLYYDVEPFLFYVLCEYDDLGYHFVGYFSKEKRASSQNNVSCILTLPHHQRKGYGNLLIDFSYLLTRVEKKTGSPEKPLSDMGLVSYRNYWRLILCRYLLAHVSEDRTEKKGLSVKQMSDDTGLTPDDVISALEGLRCLVRDPQTEVYAFRVDPIYCRDYIARWESKKYVTLNPSHLTWTPYVMGRGNATNFELGPALTAIAPREEEDEPKVEPPPPVLPMPNGDASASPPSVNGVNEKPLTLEVDGMVIESTEPNETREKEEPAAASDLNDKTLQNGTVGHTDEVEAAVEASVTEAQNEDETDWTKQYNDIPVTRFVVFPPLSRRVDRPRPTVARTPVPRTTSSSRPRIRRSAGSARRSSTSRPKSSSSRRKTGGTGRGPGRWPKGTKKSDYGNADSGPGLPPAWIAERNRLAAIKAQNEVDKHDKKGSSEDSEDTVQVQTEPGKADKRNGVNGNASKAKASPRPGKTKSKDTEGDTVMAEGDADGDDE